MTWVASTKLPTTGEEGEEGPIRLKRGLMTLLLRTQIAQEDWLDLIALR